MATHYASMQHTYIMTYIRCVARRKATAQQKQKTKTQQRTLHMHRQSLHGSPLRGLCSPVVRREETSPRQRRAPSAAPCRGLYIDATLKGGPARFINHSCDPNCETQKWIVRGETRVGIFALRTIRPGQEITYNYHLEWNGFQRIPCAPDAVPRLITECDQRNW
jgi:SET domain